MEETLGKRIVSNRKRLGLTQDRLAELLGVTAQAVSKWENDQSCPDISILPKLSEIFGTSIDALLGCEQPRREEKVYEAEVISDSKESNEDENEGVHLHKGNWEFRYDGGKKSSIGIALWVLLVGGLLLASILMDLNISLWEILWPSALLMFGLFGLYPKFSVFRLGCGLFGCYFLLETFSLTPVPLSSKLVLPIVVILFGLSLLADTLHKPGKSRFSVKHNGKPINTHQCYCTLEDESFQCGTSFGENTHHVDLPRLRSGQAQVSFGELTVDLSGCEELADNCRIEANCSFGELLFLVPRCYRVEADSSTAFAAFEYSGSPDPAPKGVIFMDASVSFGQITVKYI